MTLLLQTSTDLYTDSTPYTGWESSDQSGTALLTPDIVTPIKEPWSEYSPQLPIEAPAWNPECAAGDDLDDDEAYFLEDEDDDDDDTEDDYDEEDDDDDFDGENEANTDEDNDDEEL